MDQRQKEEFRKNMLEKMSTPEGRDFIADGVIKLGEIIERASEHLKSS
jgi:hypothetical protein